jgi:hypothetical protein
MKRMILYLLLAVFPALVFAQQKNTPSPQEQLQTEMKRFQEDMQNQLKLLQDSISELRSELNERDHERMKGWDFHYNVPGGSFTVPEFPALLALPDMLHLEGLLNKDFEDEGNWDFRFEMPPVPCEPSIPPVPSWNYEWNMPQLDNLRFHVEPRDWHFDFRVPHPPMKKHRHQYEDILETLPFYRFFKS